MFWIRKLQQTDQPADQPQCDSYIPLSNFVWRGYNNYYFSADVKLVLLKHSFSMQERLPHRFLKSFLPVKFYNHSNFYIRTTILSLPCTHNYIETTLGYIFNDIVLDPCKSGIAGDKQMPLLGIQASLRFSFGIMGFCGSYKLL